MKNQRLYFLSLVLIGFGIFMTDPFSSFSIMGLYTTTEALIMNLTLAVGVPVAAHFGGRFWKIGRRWIAIILTLIVVWQFILLRQVMLDYMLELGILTPEEAQTGTLLLVVVNILLYAVATILSLARHDISPKIEEVG